MWKITRDYITDQKEKAEGKTWTGKGNWDKEKEAEKEKFSFRLLDDDRQIYLHGISSNNSNFAPLDYFEGRLGVTIIEYKNEKGQWEIL